MKLNIIKLTLLCCVFSLFQTADDDSDTNPHDFDNADVECGLSTHLNIGQHSFSQMQVCDSNICILFLGENLFGSIYFETG